jgi:ADP-ribose pyrophosphatase
MRSTEKIISSKKVYTGRNITVYSDIIEIKGRKMRRDLVKHPGSAVILPLADIKKRDILLIKQYRYAAGKIIIEAPAGTRDGGESTLACAKREIAEETGFKAKKFSRILTFYPSPGVSNECMDVYVATGLSPAVKHPDWDEDILVFRVSLEKALKMVEDGKIMDSKTISSLLMLDRIYRSPGRLKKLMA